MQHHHLLCTSASTSSSSFDHRLCNSIDAHFESCVAAWFPNRMHVSIQTEHRFSGLHSLAGPSCEQLLFPHQRSRANSPDHSRSRPSQDTVRVIRRRRVSTRSDQTMSHRDSGPWRPVAIHSHTVILQARTSQKGVAKVALSPSGCTSSPGSRTYSSRELRDVLSATLPDHLSPGAPQNPVRIPERLDLS
jgi:hypothetical protein